MAADQPIRVMDQNYPSYPILLAKRLGKDAPVRLWAIGRLDLINIPKSALFCSKRCPGDAILEAINKPKRPGILQGLVLNEKTLYPNIGIYFFGFTSFF